MCGFLEVYCATEVQIYIQVYLYAQVALSDFGQIFDF